eukprot:SAG11_NODE_790_length_7155_cov_217.330641_3_plen_102_part_00
MYGTAGKVFLSKSHINSTSWYSYRIAVPEPVPMVNIRKQACLYVNKRVYNIQRGTKTDKIYLSTQYPGTRVPVPVGTSTLPGKSVTPRGATAVPKLVLQQL